ncbi:MAG: lamin tail domain-containing protein [Lewinellaceae bacterium]|nr:lamin tail domain-containing protein [Lewinellaceae bacterium]
MNCPLSRAAACLPFLSLFFFIQKPAHSQDVILQGFYWNTHPGDVTNTTSGGIWWDSLSNAAPQIAAAGFQTVWTPPPTKGFAGVWDMGYGTYDYFDLGEFDSKFTTRTRHGSRSQLDGMLNALHSNGLKAMCDVVLNHRGGADAQAMYQVGGGTGYNVFTPPSSRILSGPAHVHPNLFHADNDPDYHNAIFFEDLCYFNENDANPPTNPDGTAGAWFFGAPTLMGSMGDSLIMWGRWLLSDVGFDEFRLDAVKHIDPWFTKKFLIESVNGAQPFAVGESFDYTPANLVNYWSEVQATGNSGGVKNAKISLFDFPLRAALKTVLNDGSGSADLYNTLGNAGLVWSTGMGGFDVVTWLESHDTDRQGFIGASSGCPVPAGATCLEVHTESDHDPIVSDKEDMGYPFLLASEGRPVVFWKDWFWYGMADDIAWQIALRAATATGGSEHIQNLGGDWNAGAAFEPNNNGGNMFAMRRNGLTGGVSDGMILGLNDDPNQEHAVWVNTPFSNKILKDYSDSYLFQATEAFGDSRALIKAQPRDYSWWAPTGLYPKPAGIPASHFTMNAPPGGYPHFIAICAADAANFIVNGAPIAAGDELAVKNTGGQVVGIGRIGQGFRWDGVHDMIIEVLGGASAAAGMVDGEVFRLFVYDGSASAEVEIATVRFAASGENFNFSPSRPNSPNRNGNFSTFALQTSGEGEFAYNAGFKISRIRAFNSQPVVNQPFCAGDNAATSVYGDGWQNGDNGGTGFGAWTLSPNPNAGNAGFFISASNFNGDGDNNADGDINTSGIAWGTYANSGGTANAVRNFVTDLTPGSEFTLALDNGFLDNGASIGFGLQNSSGNNLLEFYYRGGDAVNSYKRNDNAGEQNIGLGFTDEGLSLSFSLLTATTYEMTVTPLGGGAPVTFSGTLSNPAGGQNISRVRLFNFNSGNGGARDAFFNSMGVCFAPTLVINEVDYDQVGTDMAEFIELKNAGSTTVNLDPYTLELVNGGDNTVYQTVDLPNVNLAPGDYFVICGNGSGVPNCDFPFPGALSNRIQNGAPDAVRLLLNVGVLVDALSYEGTVTGAAEGTGTAASDSDDTHGVGLSRLPDGNDTNDNNSDFALTCSTPGTANTGNANSDGDSYPDTCDNCPNDDNESQADTDEDGLGDACDDCPLAVDGLANFNAGACNCEPGYFQVTEIRNSETVIIGCQPCPPGSFCPDGIASVPCPAGYYSNVSGSASCIPCAAGSFNATTGATVCTKCLAGEFSDVAAATECTACPAGKFSAITGATMCENCPAGTFSATAGATACTFCEAGYFNATPGATACQACEAGYFSDMEGATSCQACAAGSYSSAPAATSCTACSEGTFSSAPGSVNCTACPAGKFSATTGATMCENCPAGTFSATTGASACTLCEAGYFNATPGASACQACEAGYFSAGQGAVACTACAVNTYSNATASTACLSCGSGFYSPPASTACTMCAVSFTATPSAESCAGYMDGQIAISNVTGGTAPFLYSIDNGANYAATSTFTGLSAGFYLVRVLDDYGCESDAQQVEVVAGTCPLTFSGTIIWEHDNISGVKDATVALSGAGTGSGQTDINGDYTISIPLVSGNYTLKPLKNSNKTNGLSVVDALVVQQHLTGNAPITDPYKQVAADVNKSNSITTLDAALINQVLLGNPAANAIFNTSWRFVPASYALPLPPWGFPEKIDLTGVNADQSGLDFTGIKLGDLAAGYADPANFGGGSPKPLRWRIGDQLLDQTGPLALDVATAAFDDLAALQCAFRFDPAQLALDSIEVLQRLPLAAGDFGLFDKNKGEIRLVWSNGSKGFDLEAGASVFRLHFQVLQTGNRLSEALGLGSAILPGFAYTSTLVESAVELDFVNVTATGAPLSPVGLQLFQNRPNPFHEATTVSFFLPEACTAQLRVLDVGGRELLRLDGEYPAGLNAVDLHVPDASGVLYYELVTPFGKLVRKMTGLGR